MANNSIRHQGIVENIDGCHVRVRIVQTSACAACSVKAHCNSADTKEKLIDVQVDKFTQVNKSQNSSVLRVGDSVWVIGELSMGAWAVFFAFIVPFLILVISLFVFMAIWNDELGCALGSLALLIPYYCILWLNKSRLSRKFSFKIQVDE